MFELGEDLLDWIEIGGIFWQEEEFGAGRADERPHGFALVAAEIVQNDDVAGTKRGHEDLLDIDPEALAVDRPLEQPRRVDAVVAQRSQERRGLPAAVRD